MDIVQILIFIGVILFVVSKKYKETEANRPKTVDEFPEEEEMKELGYGEEGHKQMDSQGKGPRKIHPTAEVKMEEILEKFKSEHPTQHKKKKKTMKQKPQQSMVEPMRENMHTNSEVKTEPSHKKEKSQPINLRSHSEAKRAFIYSEIFQRKY